MMRVMLVKNFDYNVGVELINPIADTVATVSYMSADVDWYIKVVDIILKKLAPNLRASPV